MLKVTRKTSPRSGRFDPDPHGAEGGNRGLGAGRRVLLSTALALGLPLLALVPGQDILTGQLLHWKFTEGTGTSVADQSGNGVTGTLYNSPVWTNGYHGRGLYFCSNATRPYVMGLVDGGIMRPGGEDGAWTVSCWFRLGGWSTRGGENYIWGRKGAHAGLDIWSNAGATSLAYRYRVSSGSFSNISVVTNLLNDRWYHAVVTSSNRKFTLYLNGVSQGQMSIAAGDTCYAYNTEMHLGWIGGGTWGVTGSVDEFRVYGRALSPEDIQGFLPPSIECTNLASNQTLPVGTALSGTCTDGPAWAQVTVTNGLGMITQGTPTWITGNTWTFDPGLAPGAYVASFAISNSNSLGAVAAAIPFQVSNLSSLTVRTVDLNGAAVPGGLLESSIAAVRTNDVSGEVLYTALPAGRLLHLTNLAPTVYGRPAMVTQFAMPPSNTLVVWPADVSWIPTPATAVSQGLLLQWDFNEGTGTTVLDASGNGNTGRLYNAPLWTNGFYGSALHFSSNATRPYVQTTLDGGILRPGGEDSIWTVSCWVRLGTWPTRGGENYIWGRRGSHAGLEIQSNGGTTALSFRYRVASGACSNLTLATNLVNDRWYHTAVTCSNRRFTLYLNGVAQGQLSLAATDVCYGFSTDFYLGWIADSTYGHTGSIDEVRVYQRTLSLPELVALASPRLSLTNVEATGWITPGQTLAGLVSSGASVARVLFSNTAGVEITNLSLTLDGTGRWTAAPSLPLGAATATFVLTNGFGHPATLTLPLEVVTFPTLTVRSLSPDGRVVAGGRLFGPATTAFGGYRRGDASGEVVFTGIPSGHLVCLTNFGSADMPIPPQVTNFPMPAADTTLLWTLPEGVRTDSTAAGSAATNGRVFFPRDGSFLLLPLTGAPIQAMSAVTVHAVGLRGGTRTLLHQGMVSPADPVLRIPAEVLRKVMGLGVWILEISFPRSDLDLTRIPVQRQLLFVGN